MPDPFVFLELLLVFYFSVIIFNANYGHQGQKAPDVSNVSGSQGKGIATWNKQGQRTNSVSYMRASKLKNIGPVLNLMAFLNLVPSYFSSAQK